MQINEYLNYIENIKNIPMCNPVLTLKHYTYKHVLAIYKTENSRQIYKT